MSCRAATAEIAASRSLKPLGAGGLSVGEAMSSSRFSTELFSKRRDGSRPRDRPAGSANSNLGVLNVNAILDVQGANEDVVEGAVGVEDGVGGGTGVEDGEGAEDAKDVDDEDAGNAECIQ